MIYIYDIIKQMFEKPKRVLLHLYSFLFIADIMAENTYQALLVGITVRN